MKKLALVSLICFISSGSAFAQGPEIIETPTENGYSLSLTRTAEDPISSESELEDDGMPMIAKVGIGVGATLIVGSLLFLGFFIANAPPTDSP